MLGSIVPQALTALAFGSLIWVAWVTRHRFRLLSVLLWLLVGIDLVFGTWFVVEAWGCTPSSCENDQAAVIVVWMVLLDLLLVAIIAVAGIVAWFRPRRPVTHP